MSDGDRFDELLNRHATRKNTEEEERILLREAGQDQERFDALVHEELLWQPPEDPESRRILLAEAKPESAWSAFWGSLFRRKPVPIFAGCAAAAVLVALGIEISRTPHPVAVPAGDRADGRPGHIRPAAGRRSIVTRFVCPRRCLAGGARAYRGAGGFATRIAGFGGM